MRNVTNPIIIDQNYCDQKEACKEEVMNAYTCSFPSIDDKMSLFEPNFCILLEIQYLATENISVAK